MTKRRYSDFRQWLLFRVEDGWCDLCEKHNWPDWAWELSDYVVQPLIKITCKIKGHEPVQDHCGIPAHDHCLWCGKSMPGQAARKA